MRVLSFLITSLEEETPANPTAVSQVVPGEVVFLMAF